MFGTVDDSISLDNIMELNPEIALHLKTVDAECDKTANHFAKHQAKWKEYFNKCIHAKTFAPGDLVLVYNEQYFNGPN